MGEVLTRGLVAAAPLLGGAGDLVSKVISGVISTLNGVTPIITLVITLLTKAPAPPSKGSLGVQEGLRALGVWGRGSRVSGLGIPKRVSGRRVLF